jgi:hypothetical protein
MEIPRGEKLKVLIADLEIEALGFNPAINLKNQGLRTPILVISPIVPPLNLF